MVMVTPPRTRIGSVGLGSRRNWHIVGCGSNEVGRCFGRSGTAATENSTTAAPDADFPPSENASGDVIADGFFMSLIILITIVFNVIVIITFAKRKQLRNHSNIFILALTIADLGVAVTVMPLSVATFVSGGWPLDESSCCLWIFLDYFWCTASVNSLLSVALDRLMAVCNPIAYSTKRTINHVLSSLFAAWTLSLALTVPAVIILANGGVIVEQCIVKFDGRVWFIVYSAAAGFVVPATLIVIMYSTVVLTARRGLRRKILNFGVDPHSSDAHSFSPEQPVQSRPAAPTKPLDKKLKRLLEQERRLHIIAGVIVGVFVVCWAPFWILYLLVPLCQAPWCPSVRVGASTAYGVQWLGYANSMLNPVIYTVFNEDFRKGLIETFGKRS